MTKQDRFDYVIVGGGSAGCVLASRLSEDPSSRVLLVEAGSGDVPDAMRVPALFPSLFGTEVDWNYELEPQSHYDGSTIFPRGRTLGGSSSINLMVYIRGSQSDFDGWAENGCSGWEYANVLPFFVKAESNSRLVEPMHGTRGPLYVEDRMFTHELSHAWVDSAVAWGLPRNDDFNGSTQLGAGAYQVTCHNGLRWSAADGYLRPVLSRPNLQVNTNSQVTGVLFERSRATGVTYLRDGVQETVHANSEVILCGGVINSPQLLLLSGVGPATQLRTLGIDVVADLPGVGENLHDHTMVPTVWATRNSTDLLELATPENMALLSSGHGGPFSSNGAEVGGFVCTNNDGAPNVQFIGGPTAFVDHGRAALPLANFTMLTASAHPRSRGRLWLRSTDPLAHPHIDPAYFADPADLDDIKDGLRVVLEIAQGKPFAPYVAGLRLPNDVPHDDAALSEHARRHSQTEYHAVGTCAMGVHSGAVVDPELKVYGVEGLRVVDASVMPTVISGNTNAATIMIAEKAAELIRTP